MIFALTESEQFYSNIKNKLCFLIGEISVMN